MSRVAITGGTGFVGRHLAARLTEAGHDVVLIARGVDRRFLVAPGPRTTVVVASVTDAKALIAAFRGCDAVVHCAGINREIGTQTYEAIHVEGTRAVVAAARSAGVGRLVMLSFLRARPDGPSAYHRSKWAAEDVVRGSGVSYTVLKAGVIHGQGDHMLDHLSRAFHTFPVFGLVGLRDRPVRPVAVDDVARLLEAAALGDPRLADRTIAVLGPDEMTLGAAVRRVAQATGRRPLFVRLPVPVHRLLARALEATMTTPLIARAQVEDPGRGRRRAATVRRRAPARPRATDALLITSHPGRPAARWRLRAHRPSLVRSERRGVKTQAFLLGLIAGGLAGILLIEFGIGLPFLALAAIGVGLVIRPRPFGAAGTMIGWGAMWIAVFAAAARACAVDQNCGSSVPDVTPWIGAGIALVALGLAALVTASRGQGSVRR